MTDIIEELAAHQAELEALVAERLAQEPHFARELVDDPTTAMAPIIAAALGEEPLLDTVEFTLEPALEQLLIDFTESAEADATEVAGFDGSAPIPFPVVGGGGGGRGVKVSVSLAADSKGNIGESVMKGIVSMGNMGKSFTSPGAPTVHAEGGGVSMNGSPGASNR